MQNKKNEKKEALLNAVIKVTSRDGLERLTTKSVEAESGCSERYIFLYFGSKDAMLTQTFDRVEMRFLNAIAAAFRESVSKEKGTEAFLRRVWYAGWKELSDNPDETKFFIRYFFSEQFVRFSRENHEKNTEPVVNMFAPLFLEGHDARDSIRYVLMSMLSSSLTAINSQKPSESEAICEKAFRFMYNSQRDILM